MAKTATKVQVSSVTGLTPTQERACSLLASGAKTAEVAQKLDVPEQTIYLWQKQTTFVCYYNKQRSVIKNAAVQSLFGLMDEAVTAIRESLNSTNESVRLKAASYIIDKLQNVEVGKTDIVEAVRAEATYADTEGWGITENVFHESEYRDRLKELGVQEQDYQSSLK